MDCKASATRRAARLELAGKVAATAKTVLPKTLRLMQRITQHSVKFILEP